MLTTLALLVAGVSAAVAVPPVGFENEPVVSGLTLPTSLLFLPDGRMLVAEKGGRMVIADPADASGGAPASFATYLTITDIDVAGEHGLIDIQLAPNFASNSFLYAYYTHASSTRYRIARFTHQGSTASLASETLIWQSSETWTNRCCHHGGSISFGPDGKLYLTTGDRFSDLISQDLTSPAGKALRMNPDGSIPADNPFVDGPGGNYDYIWAYGLRNAFRSRWDLPTERFFIADVGSNEQEIAWEEVNLGIAGANYGWPFCEGPCHDQSFTDPIFSYPHLGEGASITGGIVYRGSLFPPEFHGAYFYGDYVRGWLRYLTFDGFGTVVSSFELDPSAGAVVDIKQGPEGGLYYADIVAGEVRRYVYTPGIPVARDDRAYVPPSGMVVIPVLDNDEGELDPATVTPQDLPAHGILNVNALTGAITYTHDGSATLADSFSYTVDDLDGDTSNVAQVTIKVLTGDCTLVGAGLALHLEADSGLSTSGNTVNAWTDQSSLGNDLTDRFGAPQRIAAALNGQPVVAFNGSGDALGRTGLSGLSVGAADRTIFLVARYHGSGWGGFEYGNAALNEAFGLAVSPDGFLAVRGYLAPLDFVSTAPAAGAGFLVQSAVVQAGELRHFADSELIDSRVHAFNTVAEGMRLGSTIDGVSHAEMDVAAILVYNRALSEAERQTVEDYLQIKYFVDACDNLTPTALADSAAVAPGGSVAIDVLANDFDADGTLDPATVMIIDPPAHAATISVHPATGVVTYTHNGTATTQDSFTYTVRDDAGAESNVATVSLVIRDDDCNNNGIPDVDEFSANCVENESIDCNFDGILDECDADCDASGVSDVCALTFGVVTDCMGTEGFVGDYAAGQALHAAFCQGCHNVGGVGGLGGAPNHRNRSRYSYQRKLSTCQAVVGHFGGSNSLTIDDFAHLERYLTDYTAPDDPHGGDGIPDRCQGMIDCDGDGVHDPCAIIAGLVPDCNGNGIPDSCDLAPGGGSHDCNNNGIPDECERDLLAEDFNAYADGDDPEGWYDTGPDNSLVRNDILFHVYAVAGELALGTLTTQTNIHSHYVTADSETWRDYAFTGRMRMSVSVGGVGVTFLSDYPNSDTYYRLRRGPFLGGAFHVDAHGTTISGGNATSAVVPAANQWYRFHIEVTDTGTRTEIRANIWPDGASEPAGWQIDCFDDTQNRRTEGPVGVWAYSSGAKYWDDLYVTTVISDGVCDDRDPCTVDDVCVDGVCAGTFVDCDGDGVCDALDNCPTVFNPDQVDSNGSGRGDACDLLFDADHDGDVDAEDYSAMVACVTGPLQEATPDCVAVFDADGDGDVDLIDFAAALRAFTGTIESPCD